MSILNGPTKLIAMFPAGTQNQLVKPTLERFVEDRLTELELTHDDLAEKMGAIIGTDYKIHRLTRRINSPETFPANELAAFAQVLQLKDWYADLVINFGAGINGCSVAEFDQMLHPLGCQLGRVNVAA